MKIIIRLVGYYETIDDEKYAYEYDCNVNTIFNFETLKMIFNKYNDIISVNELNNCNLTCNSKNLKKDCLIDNNTFLENETINRVFIFAGITEIKNKLVQIFKKYGYKVLANNNLTRNINKNDSDNECEKTKDKNRHNALQYVDSENSDDECKETNKIHNALQYVDFEDSDDECKEIKKIHNTLQYVDSEDSNDEKLKASVPYENTELINIKQNLDLLKDDDFVTLLRIYKTREYLFNDFYKYINSSEIIKFNKLENEIDLNNNLNLIKELNLDFQEKNIIEALKNTGNHVNLAIRYLLYNK